MDNLHEDKALQNYLGDISKYTVLSREEEREIALKAKAGDVCAREKLIKSNLKFVVKIAAKYQNRGMTLSELISDGNLGLIMAIEKFDPDKDIKLISYAVWWIKQRILYALEKRLEVTGCVHGSANMCHCKACSVADLAIENSLDPNVILYKEKLYEVIKQAINDLEEREIYVLKSYFGLDGYKEKNFTEIAKTLGISKEYARQIKLKSINKIMQKVYEEKENETYAIFSNIY